MYRLVYFLVVEDALEKDNYRSMNASAHHHLEQELRQYTWSLYDEKENGFALEMADEWAFIQKRNTDTDL